MKVHDLLQILCFLEVVHEMEPVLFDDLVAQVVYEVFDVVYHALV